MAAGAETSVVIVTYNSMATLERCLAGAFGAMEGDCELIAVDNGSSDGTSDFLRSKADETPRLTALLNADNLGYSAAANQGIGAAQGEFVLLLNPDTALRPGCLDRMGRLFKLPRTGAVGPVSNYTAGAQYVEHHIEPRSRYSFDELDSAVQARNAGRSVETKLLMGFCLMLAREAIEEVGLLDEDLFLGCDDLDYCWRLRNHGWHLRVATDCFVEHSGRASFDTLPSTEVSRHLTASTVALAKKLEGHYGRGRVPSSEDLFGIDIFDPPYDLWPDRF
jgi:GT2 family glycosyltransferase